MKLEDRLKETRKRIEEIKKKFIEEQKQQTQKIIESLNLQKIFNDKKRFNELNFILNNTTKKVKLSKEFMEDSQKIGKNYNSVFNYMDNGKLDNNAKSQLSFKPIMLKIFDTNDNNNDEINKEIDDKFGKESSVFDILNQSFKGKLVFDEKGNLLLDDNKKAEKIEKEFDDKKEVKEIEKVESSSNSETESSEAESNNNEQKQKNKNVNRLRMR